MATCTRRLLSDAARGLVPLLSLAVTAMACTRPHADPPLPPPTVLAKVLEPSSNAPLILRGPVVAGTRVRLGFKAAGVLSSVSVKEGDEVHAGQVLAHLDGTDAQARAHAARAALNKAVRDSRRASKLVADGALAPVAGDDARTDVDGASANFALASEAVKRTKLVASVSGTVYKRTAEPGEMVAAGAPVLVIEETHRPVVKVGVTASELRWIKRDQSVSVSTGDDSRVANDGQVGTTIPAKVTSVSTTPEPGDGLYTVEVTPVDGRRDALRVGELSTLKIARTRDDRMWVPIDALVHRYDRDWLFVIDETGRSKASERTVHMHAVVLGESEGKRVSLVSGLRPGEQFVSEGSYFLLDGQVVRVIEEARRIAAR